VKDLHEVMFNHTLPEVMKIKEWIDMMNALEYAEHLDNKPKDNVK